MYADFLLKFLLTTTAVWLVLALAQRCGERAAGLAARVRSAAPDALDPMSQRTSHKPVALLVGAVSPVACLPTVCAVVLLRRHRLHGHVGVAQLLHGDVRGLGVRVAFMALAACAGQTGRALALCLGLVGAFGWGLFTRNKVDAPHRPDRTARSLAPLATEQRWLAT